MSKHKNAPPATQESAGPVADNGVALYGRWIPAKLPGMQGVKTTLCADDDRSKALVIAAGSPATIELGRDGELRMAMCDATIFWDEGVDEDTGEVKQFVRTCFYTRSGDTFRTTSEYAPHFVARIIDLYGLQRLKDGIPILIRERRSKKEGRMYHDFRVEYAPTGKLTSEESTEVPF